MANRATTLLATAVAAACSLSAHANGPTQADYAKVVLYSNVTIAQDSASQWGIWEELEPTAAGPQTPLPQLPVTIDPYRPLGTVVVNTPVTPTNPETPKPAVPLCVSGAMCGFGAITSQSYSYVLERAEEVSIEAPLERMGFQLLGTVVQANEDANRWQPQSLLVTIQGVRSDVTAPTEIVDLGPLEQGRRPMGFVHTMESFEGDSYTYAEIKTDTSDPGVDAVGLMLGEIRISRYVNGDGFEGKESTQRHDVYGVWGITTAASEMNELRMSNAQATYTGKTFGADGSATGDLKARVAFGPGTIELDFNGGLNVKNPMANAKLETTAAGTTQVAGALSFRASGTINGSLISANNLQIAGANNSITGKVEGAFFGSNAAALGGVADVTARIQNSPTDAAVSARYVTPFVATKDAPAFEPR